MTPADRLAAAIVRGLQGLHDEEPVTAGELRNVALRLAAGDDQGRLAGEPGYTPPEQPTDGEVWARVLG